MTLLRRLRGALGLSLAWGTAFAALSGSLLGVLLIRGIIPPGVFTPSLVASAILRAFAVGGLAGFVFAGVLARGGRGQGFSSLSMGRVAAYGFAGAAVAFGAVGAMLGATHFVPLQLLVTAGVLFGGIGAGVSSTIFRLAQRAPAPPDELPRESESAPRLPI